jgi:hypothetical protein
VVDGTEQAAAPAAPRAPRASEWIAGCTGVLLLLYLGLVASPAGADGGGWFLALLLGAFMLLGAPPALLVALILAFTSRKRRTPRGFGMALLGVAAAIVFEILLLLSKLQPRGPLG